jgi:cell division protease FtsH
MIAEELLRKEVLFKDDMEQLLGKRPFEEDDAIAEEEEPLVPESALNPNI